MNCSVGSHARLGSGVAVAVVQAGSCSSDLTPSPETSISRGCHPKTHTHTHHTQPGVGEKRKEAEVKTRAKEHEGEDLGCRPRRWGFHLGGTPPEGNAQEDDSGAGRLSASPLPEGSPVDRLTGSLGQHRSAGASQLLSSSG